MNVYEKALNELVEQVELNTNYKHVYTHRNTLQELVERATPKKITQIDMTEEYYIEYRCPNC